jgi:hypothetical protein
MCLATVKSLYNEHQRDCPKSVHYRRCSLCRGFLLTERLCMFSALWVWEKEDDVIFVLELIQINTKLDSYSIHTCNRSNCLGWLIFNYFSALFMWWILSWSIRHQRIASSSLRNMLHVLFLPFFTHIRSKQIFLQT